MRIPLCAIVLAGAAFAQTPPTPGPNAPKAQAPAPGAPKADATGAAGRAARPTAPAPATPGPKDLKYPALHAIQIPTPTMFTLANGLKVWLLEDHELPLIHGMAMIRTGSVFDPPQRIGLAQMAGMTLRSGGTALKNGEQIDALLENIAATLESDIGETSGSVTFSALKENTDTILLLFKELLAQPGFRQDKVEAARAQLRGAIAGRYANPPAIARHEFANLIYGIDTPYGWEQQYSTVDRISRNDLRAFHERYFFPANITLGITGDFDSAQLKGFLEKLFADWTPKQPPVPEFPRVNSAPSPGVFLAERKEMTQMYFSVGQIGGLLNAKANASLQILSGALRLHLVDRFRKMSNGSEVTASWAAEYSHPGLFEVSGAAKSVSSYETIRAVQEEVDRIRTAEIGEDELRVARDSVLNSLAFAYDSKSKALEHLLTFDYYGYATDYVPQLQTALQAVTRADMLRAAKQYINPVNLTVVVAGNPALFGDPLEKLGGPVTKLDLAIPEPKPEVAASTDVSLAEGRQTLRKAQAAAGGTDKLAAVKNYSMLAEYLIDPGVPNIGGTKIVQTDRWIDPTIFRQDGTFPAGRITAYTDGRIGWIATPQGWGALAGTQRNQVFGDLFRVYFRLLLSDRIEGRTVNGIDANHVQISDATGQVATVEFDPDTGLPRRVAYDTAQAASAPIYSEDVYEDFRDVGGIKLPFKITINQGGHQFADVNVTEYKLNGGLKPLDLARRPQ